MRITMYHVKGHTMKKDHVEVKLLGRLIGRDRGVLLGVRRQKWEYLVGRGGGGGGERGGEQAHGGGRGAGEGRGAAGDGF